MKNKAQELNKHELFEKYAVQLKAIEDVEGKLTKNNDSETWVFTSAHPHALKVTLEYDITGMISGEVALQIEGTDCGYWHTEEQADLDFHLAMAEAALKGDVTYNISPVFKFREVCFKVGNAWQCTRVSDTSASYGYIKKRRKLRTEIDKPKFK